MEKSILSILLLLIISFCAFNTQGQVGIGTSSPNSKAVLELKSPGNNQGFLVPRLTTAERTTISGLSASESGLLVFDTDTNKFYYWSGSAWIVIEDSVGTDSQTLSFTFPNLNISGGNSINLSAINTDGQTLTYTSGTGLLAISGGNNVTISGTVPGGGASGDLTGTYPGPTIATGAGTNIVTAVNNAATTGTVNTNRLNAAVVLDTESPAAGDVSGSFTGGLQINANAVTSAEILNAAVTDAKIGTGITVSKLSASATAGQVLTTVGTTTTWAVLPDASATNEIQDLSLTTNTLALSGDATTVNLAPYLDNTDAQTLTFTSPNLSIASGNSVNLSAINTDAQTLSFTSPNLSISGGNSINLSTINTDNQDLSLATNTLSLSGDATTVNLAPYLDNTDNQDLSLTTNTLSLSGDATTVNLAPYLDNTDAQTLTFTSPNLSIAGGNSVNLSTINTDAQTLSFTSPNLSISGGNSINLSTINTDNQDLGLSGNTLSLTNDGTTVSLAAYLDNTDAQNLSLGTRTGTQQPVNISGGTSVTIDVADNDNSITNEIQDLSLTTNTLALSGDATTVNLAPYLDNTDNQDLALAGNTLSLTNDGTTVSLAGYLDNTDSQDLSLAGNTLSLSGDASTVSLSAYLDNTDNQDLTLTGNTLSLTNDGTTVSLSGYLDNTDAQTLTFTPATSALAISGGNSVTVTATGTASGDLTGTYPSPTVDGLQGRPVAATLPGTGEVLKWNGASWAPGTDNSAGAPALNTVLGTGNNAGAQAAVNFSAISVNRADTPGALNVNGSHYTGFTALGTVTSYAVAADDYLIIGTSTGGVQTTATLPDASTCIGRILIFRGRSVGSVAAAGLRVQASSGDTIDGGTITAFLTPVTNSLISITIVAISANEWITIAKSDF